MKTKFTSFLILVLAAASLPAQVFTSGFETWTNPTTPTNWLGSVASHTTNLAATQSLDAKNGTYSCQVEVTGTSHRRFSSKAISVSTGDVLVIKFWAKGQGDIRTGLHNGTGYEPYNSYINVNTTTWTEYSQQVLASASSTAAELIFSVNATVAPNHLLIDDVEITLGTAVSTPIYDIQYTADVSGDSPKKGSAVTTGGIVTGYYKEGYYIQNGNGPWSGLHIADTINKPANGDSIIVTGQLDEFFGMTQIANPVAYQVVSSGNTIPSATIITTAQASEESYESVLVQLSSASAKTVANNFGEWTVNDGSGDITIQSLGFSTFSPSVGTAYDIIGICNYSFSARKVKFRKDFDVQTASGVRGLIIESKGNIIPNPTAGVFSFNSNIEYGVLEIFNMQGKTVYADETYVSGQRISLSTLESGSYFAKMYGKNKISFSSFIIAR